MFKHSLLLTYRTFKKFKSSFFINLLGLSTGLACTLLIYLWVNDELQVDKFHEKDARLFQVMERQQRANDIEVTEATPGLLSEALAEEMPEVEYATASSGTNEFTLSVEERMMKATGQYVGKDFFNVFSYDLHQGDANQVLSDKNAVVISEELAMRLFNTTENVLGKAISFPNHEKLFFVSGVFENVPANSSAHFDFVLSFEEYKEVSSWILDWKNNGAYTYLVLKPEVDIHQFNQKIADFVKRKEGEQHITLFAKPYSENYLYGKYENGLQAGGRIEYVRLFSIIAIFILAIACINYMNLSTAKAARRAKEVGVKKAIGANRKTLIFQYLGESVLMTFLSLILALILVVFFLPQFNEITGKQISFSFNTELVLAILFLTLFTALIAGSYPAFYLSGFKSVTVLKGGVSGLLSNSVGEIWAREGLVVFQFTLSIILIVAVLVVYKQIEYTQVKHLGYNKDNIIHFEAEGKIGENLDVFLSEVEDLPGILHASSIGHSLVEGGHRRSSSTVQWEGKNPDDIVEMENVMVNYGMIELLEIEMLAGRTYSKSFSDESSKIIFNEAAIEAMGLKDPIGKVIKLWDEDRQIVGVAKDFHFLSFHEKVTPLFFILRPENSWIVMAKIEAGKEQEAIANLQELHHNFNPGLAFDFKFQDEGYQAQYEAEQRVSVLSRYFAGIAILISCLGLYGLVAFAAEQRRKEIGIRKVLGASVSNIMALFSKDFIKLVSISIVVGSAVSWIAMSKWLEGFAYRIELAWWVFAAAGAAALLIAVCTVSYQAVKAARANPVKNLRTE